MNEWERQQYLEQMGLTVWVARHPLPAALPLPELALDSHESAPVVADETACVSEPEPTQVASTPGAGVEHVTPAAHAGITGAVEAETVEKEPVEAQAVATEVAAAETVVQATDDAAPVQPEPGGSTAEPAPLAFALESTPLNGVLLVTQLPAQDAPGLGREALGMYQSLVQYFGRSNAFTPKQFRWPLPSVESDELVGESVLHHLQALAAQAGTDKILLLLAPPLLEALLGVPRYQMVMRGDYAVLAVSTLEEMLADPLTHKRTSWHAMVEAGFYRPLP